MVYCTSCCGCIGLEKGSTIIAGLQMIIGAIAMVYKSYLAITLNKQMETEDDPNWLIYRVAVASAVVSALHVIFGLILYKGIQRKHIKSLSCWLVFTGLVIVASLLFLVIILVQSIGAGAATGEVVGKFFFGLAVVAFETYIVCVVYSFYQMLKSDDSMNGY